MNLEELHNLEPRKARLIPLFREARICSENLSCCARDSPRPVVNGVSFFELLMCWLIAFPSSCKSYHWLLDLIEHYYASSTTTINTCNKTQQYIIHTYLLLSYYCHVTLLRYCHQKYSFAAELFTLTDQWAIIYIIFNFKYLYLVNFIAFI